MTPANVSTLSTRDRHKLRKPAVEKLRRDRINSCIEQLKVLLENRFHKQEPNGKLEKADVLEMTVLFLKQQLQPRGPPPPPSHSHGYTRCWEETLHFLSREEAAPDLHRLHAATPTPPLSSTDHTQAAGKQPGGADRAVWRPW